MNSTPTGLPSNVYEWARLAAEATPTGERRPILEGATGTLGRLCCHASTLKAGERSHPPHQHPEEEMIIVKDGTLEATLNEKTITMGPGSVYFIAPHDLHGVRNPGPAPASYYVIRWWTPQMLDTQAK